MSSFKNISVCLAVMLCLSTAFAPTIGSAADESGRSGSGQLDIRGELEIEGRELIGQEVLGNADLNQVDCRAFCEVFKRTF